MEAEAASSTRSSAGGSWAPKLKRTFGSCQTRCAAIDLADRVDRLAHHRGERAGVEGRAARRVDAWLPVDAGPRLVQQVVAEDAGGRRGTARRRDAMRRRSGLRGPPRPGPGRLPRSDRRRAAAPGWSGSWWESRCAAWRQAVVLDRPVGPALALELLVVEVLVEVEQPEDAVLVEDALGRRDWSR